MEIEAPGTAAATYGACVGVEVGVLNPVAPATPSTLLRAVARVVAAATGDVPTTRPTVVVAAETPVVNTTCGTTYVLEEYVMVV